MNPPDVIDVPDMIDVTLRRLLRGLLLLSLVSGASLAAGCGPARSDGTPTVEGDPDFPTGYASWHKVNAETIVRAEEGVAREIYARASGDLGVGTVLVKEQHALRDGASGPLQHVAVMRRTSGAETGGWTFQIFDPDTHTRLTDDVTTCVGCHTIRAESDYLFTAREALLGQ